MAETLAQQTSSYTDKPLFDVISWATNIYTNIAKASTPSAINVQPAVAYQATPTPAPSTTSLPTGSIVALAISGIAIIVLIVALIKR